MQQGIVLHCVPCCDPDAPELSADGVVHSSHYWDLDRNGRISLQESRHEVGL